MIKAIVMMILFDLPFLLTSAVFFYLSLTADEKALTDDGFNLKTFFYLMGGGFLGITLIINAFTFRWMLKKGSRLKRCLLMANRE